MTSAWAMERQGQKVLKRTDALKSHVSEEIHSKVLREVTEGMINRLISGHPRELVDG